MECFGLNIGWDITRDFLMEAALTGLPPNFLYTAVTATTMFSSILLFFVCKSFDDNLFE